MNRYIVGSVTIFGQLINICWDNRKNQLDAVEPGPIDYMAGPEVNAYTRAIIEHELLSAGMGQLNKLDGYKLDVSDGVPVWLRHRHERAVVERLVTDAVAMGYRVSVNDGEEYVVKRSRDCKAIMQAMFSVDEEWLKIRTLDDEDSVGSFYLIYGNDGWDVIADSSYSTATEAHMLKIQRGADELATAIENKYGA